MRKIYHLLKIRTNLYSQLSKMCNVGLIIIGNEVLNGQVRDDNSVFVARSLPIFGLRLRRISVIPDEIDVIAQEVFKFSKDYDYVITSGGIGTTHDDVTFEGVALAFNEPLCQHEVFTRKLIKYFNLSEGETKTDSRLKLARIPESSNLIFGTDVETGLKIPYPVVCCKNVFILPGIPSLFCKGFNIIKSRFPKDLSKIYTSSLYFKIEESTLTDGLNIVVEKFQNSVIFGSYPVLNNNFYKVKVTMESNNENVLDSASDMLKQVIGEDNMSTYDPYVFINAADNVFKLAYQAKIKHTLDNIEKTFQMYQSNEILVAFTGGKDCTVLLHLIYAYLKKNQRKMSIIRLLFVRTMPSFAEVEDFIQLCLKNYEIVPPMSNFLEYNGSMKDSLQNLKQDYPDIRAVFMGTRKTDPNGNQQVFSRTTEGWPSFDLINPVIDWTYEEIWRFLLDLQIPYCSLYDKGYTSVGGINNTLPNPKLLYRDANGKAAYHPAYKLKEESDERNGREPGK